MPEIQYTYETIGKQSYLVANFQGGKDVINYQLQMLTNNEIRNIIKANKRQNNDDILISYNITSKIALSQLDEKRKIPKEGIINIIEGALAALEDIEEYQLVSSGIVFDEQYIFVKPGTYEPSFVYLPCGKEDSGIEPLKGLIRSLLIGSKVEMTNDNFVQTLLEALNKPALSAEDLKKLCNGLKSNKNTGREAGDANKLIAPKPSPRYEQRTNQAQKVDNFNEMSAPIPNIPADNKGKTPKASEASETPEASNGKKQKKSKETKKESKGNTPKKNLFLILQLVLLAVIVAVSVSGILNDENGALNVQYLFGIVLVLGCADFVLYREMFKQNKDKDTEEKEKKKSTTAKKMPNKPMVSMPGKNTAYKSAPVEKEQPSSPGKQVNAQPRVQPKPQPAATIVPQPDYIPPKSTPLAYDQYSDFGSEDTVVIKDDDIDCAYLEYFENGLSNKIKLNKESVLVGKLRGQCDYVINNNKISKMHAEFITRGTDYFVKDYNSTNGTYINGATQRISSNTEYPIVNGDKITLANIDMIFRC